MRGGAGGERDAGQPMPAEPGHGPQRSLRSCPGPDGRFDHRQGTWLNGASHPLGCQQERIDQSDKGARRGGEGDQQEGTGTW